MKKLSEMVKHYAAKWQNGQVNDGEVVTENTTECKTSINIGPMVSSNVKFEPRKYTKAHISHDDLFWLFGVEFGIIDDAISSMDDLEKYVDEHYTTQEIIDLTLNPCD